MKRNGLQERHVWRQYLLYCNVGVSLSLIEDPWKQEALSESGPMIGRRESQSQKPRPPLFPLFDVIRRPQNTNTSSRRLHIHACLSGVLEVNKINFRTSFTRQQTLENIDNATVARAADATLRSAFYPAHLDCLSKTFELRITRR